MKHKKPLPQRPLLLLLASNNTENTNLFEPTYGSVHRGYGSLTLQDEELSDYVKFRLMLARLKAMDRYFITINKD